MSKNMCLFGVLCITCIIHQYCILASGAPKYPVNRTQEMRDYLEQRLAGKKAKRLFVSYIEPPREVRNDLDRILDHLAQYQVENPALRIREIIEAINRSASNDWLPRKLRQRRVDDRASLTRLSGVVLLLDTCRAQPTRGWLCGTLRKTDGFSCCEYFEPCPFNSASRHEDKNQSRSPRLHRLPRTRE
jgi:hypothetical protein